MTREEFEQITQESFDLLPARFRGAIENVHIVVEDTDDETARKRAGVRRGSMLLGLYEGIPLNKRTVDYGVYPVLPDRITLYQRNIESVARTNAEIRDAIRDVLIHEIGHYFGMSEQEIRDAGY
jgi:predicted Zn-dependent protease with MMP-like domain